MSQRGRNGRVLRSRGQASSPQVPEFKLEDVELTDVLQALYGDDESVKGITLVTGNGTEIKAHKCVLGPFSGTLMTTLNENNKIEMLEYSEEAVTILVKYCYGFEFEIKHLTCKLSVELFKIAYKFKIRHLVEGLIQLINTDEVGLEWFSASDILGLYLEVKDGGGSYVFDILVLMTRIGVERIRASPLYKGLEENQARDLDEKLRDADIFFGF